MLVMEDGTMAAPDGVPLRIGADATPDGVPLRIGGESAPLRIGGESAPLRIGGAAAEEDAPTGAEAAKLPDYLAKLRQAQGDAGHALASARWTAAKVAVGGASLGASCAAEKADEARRQRER